MEPIFDRTGTIVGWLNNNYIYNSNANTVLAFIHNNSVFDYRGRYHGRFLNNFFRDKSGDAIAFIRGAKNGPLTPIIKIAPIPPIPSIPPIPPIPSLPPIAPTNTLSWSVQDWQTFFN